MKSAGSSETGSNHGMRKISTGLVGARDGVALRRGAGAQARKLREGEPHPVALLTARVQFFQRHLVEGACGATKRSSLKGSILFLRV